MIITITINTANRAFESQSEVDRILRGISSVIRGCGGFDAYVEEFGSTPIHDINKQTCGRLAINKGKYLRVCPQCGGQHLRSLCDDGEWQEQS